MTASYTRAQLLGRSARNGAALLVAGSAFAQFPAAAGADPLPDGDLAYARLLVGAELLAADFYSQAIAASNSGKVVTKYLKLARRNEQEHYASVAGILSGAQSTPAVAGDFTFRYPAGTFTSEGAMLKFGARLEAIVLGAYLGAIGAMQTSQFKTGLAQIAACEAQHLSYFTAVEGGKAFDASFPPALTIDQVSNAFDAYAS